MEDLEQQPTRLASDNPQHRRGALATTFVPEPLEFLEGKVRKLTKGKQLKNIASDDVSFTGPEQGFFEKFGSDSTE